jgi:predicted transcriptional regulator
VHERIGTALRSRLGEGEPGSLVGIVSTTRRKASEMLASDLQVSLPLINRKTPTAVAARLLTRGHLAGLVVADDAGTPVAVISSSDVLGLMVPRYLRDDISLAAVLDEAGSEELWAGAGERLIGEILDDDGVKVWDIIHVDNDATIIEVAASLVRAGAQIAVVDGADEGLRFITLPDLMDAILVICGDDGAAA